MFERKCMLLVITRNAETTADSVTPMTWDNKLDAAIPIMDTEMSALGIFLKVQSIKTVHTLFCILSDMKPTMVKLPRGEGDGAV